MPQLSKAARESIRKQMEAAKSCPHPTDQRTRIGLGIYCDLCKIRVAMVSDTQAEKLITKSIKDMF